MIGKNCKNGVILDEIIAELHPLMDWIMIVEYGMKRMGEKMCEEGWREVWDEGKVVVLKEVELCER